MDDKNADVPTVCKRTPAYRKKKTVRCAWAEDTNTASKENAVHSSWTEVTEVVDLRKIPASMKKANGYAWAEDGSSDDLQSIPASNVDEVHRITSSRKKAVHHAWAENGNDDLRTIPVNHADEAQRIPASKKKRRHHDWTEDGNSDDGLHRPPASAADEVQRISASRKNAARRVWAGNDSDDDDHQRIPTNSADKIQKITASRKKAGRCAWAEGGNTDAQGGDAMTDVEKLWASVNPTKVCASPTKPAARRTDAWSGAPSNKTDETDETASLSGPRGFQKTTRPSTAWGCLQTAISDLGDRDQSAEQVNRKNCDLVKDQAGTWDRQDLFMGLVEALEAGIKKLDDTRKIYEELTQRPGDSGMAASAAVQAESSCGRTRVLKNPNYEARDMEYPAMSDFSELEETDDSDQEEICKELVEALEDCTREVEEEIEQFSMLNRLTKQMALAGVPLMEASSSTVVNKTTEDSVACKVEERRAEERKEKRKKESEGKKEKKPGKKKKWFRSLLCCLCWLPCIHPKPSRKNN